MSDAITASMQSQPWVRGAEGGWQCPWSNCFPQLYLNSNQPCAKTPYTSFRLLNEHIWKYHSNLRSCDQCDIRFNDVNRKNLERVKYNHSEEYHRSNAEIREESSSKNRSKRQKGEMTNTKHPIETMTLEQDEKFRKWQDDKAMAKQETRDRFNSLCRCLFGDNISLPDNPYYDYLLHEHTVNPSSAFRGEYNLYYVEGRFGEPIASDQGQGLNLPFLAPPQYTPGDPLSLDDEDDAGAKPKQWSVPRGPDSGYASGSMGPSQEEQVAEQSGCLSPSSNAPVYLRHLHGNATIDRDGLIGSPELGKLYRVEDIDANLVDWGSEDTGGTSN